MPDTQPTAIPWRKREDHPELFEDGTRYLVAVPMHDDCGGGFEMHVVTVRIDEGAFGFDDAHGDSWCAWSWEDVSHYIVLDGKGPTS